MDDLTTTHSPFLPGTQMQYAWDSTSLGWLKECPRKYFYSMIEGWRTRSESVHLDFGIWYHRGLEIYDRLRAEGLSHDDATEEMVGQALAWTWTDGPWKSDHPAKNRETLIRSLIWYVDYFKDDPAKTIVLDNGKPAVELSFKLELEHGPYLHQPYILCGHMDRIAEYLDGIYILDRKTSASTITSYYFDQFNPDNQMSLYTFAGKIIYKLPIKGVVIDAVQTAVGFSRFSRGFTHRTDNQLNEWLKDSVKWFRLAEHYAEEKYWPMNDKSCHKYGGCQFRKICSKSPEVRDVFLKTDFYKKEWNPLVPR